MKTKIKDEDKFTRCKHNNENGHCTKKNITVMNGYSSIIWCADCKEFIDSK